MNLSIIAKDLFNKIRGQFPSVQLGDSQGTITKKPEEARFFDFDFNSGGNTLGKVSISISEEEGLVVLHNKDFTEGTDEAVKNDWYGFLKEMGQFAKARVLGFDTRDITKSNLEKRDYEFLGKEKEVEQVSESNLYGTTKTSFQSVGEARLVIKHSAPVDQTVAGGRSHKIESIFIESSAGERFKYPIKHLNGARAMARHVSEGGNPFDSFGKHIVGLSEELSKLRSFKTYMNRSNVMAEGLKEYQSIVDERIETIKTECQKLQRATAYKETFENFQESTLEEVPEDIKKNWIDELTIKTFKEELQDVFPYIYKLISEKTAVQSLDPESFEAHGYQGGTEPRKYEYDLAGDYEPEKAVTDKDAMDVKELLNKAGIEADVQPNEMRYQGIVIHTDAPRDAVEKVLGGMIETLNTSDSFNEFEDAMESIISDDNELFSNDPEEKDQAIKRLNALMAKHFPVGVNGTNGIESLAGIIDDEEFNNSIRNASKENSDACLRPMIMDYVMKRDPQVATKLDTGDMDNEPKEEEDVAEGHYPHIKSFDKLYGIKDIQQYKAMADDAQSMDMEEFKDTYNSTIDMAGDFYQDHQKNEAITFEDIKPYVSMYKGDDGKTVFDVLNKDGDSVKKFGDAKTAMEYLHKNFDELRYGSKEKEAMVDPEGNPQYGDESKEIALDQWNNMSKEEKEQYGSFSAYLKSDDFQVHLDHLRSKFEKDEETKPEMPNASEEDVQEFVKSFYDYTNNQFPKGETAVITAVEKKFGDSQIKTAQEAIARLMSDKDPKMSRIKKLAGVQ